MAHIGPIITPLLSQTCNTCEKLSHFSLNVLLYFCLGVRDLFDALQVQKLHEIVYGKVRRIAPFLHSGLGHSGPGKPHLSSLI